ncbi:uncharacterized protein LOC112506026 [Cynara cardunculus var. scolymus]|uniref:uncharacterized protein LOC112506026 n=1 Tax=Cynara cardunculus var. scolymus TaxID=59895 RepID=UPI000D63159D|nr:uncharacterized protein LOC112506026 [Cynara cardunculus var. scolymus]
MEANNANVVSSDTSKKNNPILVWDTTTFMVFIDLCMNEVKNGNRPGSHFNKLGWGNIEKKIKEWTRKSFDKKVTNTQGDKDLAKFRDVNLEIYQVYYEPLFQNSVDVGDKPKAPVECHYNSGPTNVEDEEDHDGKGDSDEVNLGDDDKHLFPQSSSSKRKKSNNVAPTRSTKRKSSVTSSFEDKLDNVLEVLSSRNT